MPRARTYRRAPGLALVAMLVHLLWPSLSLAVTPDRVAICTGAGLTYVDDPLAPVPAASPMHDCPCCMLLGGPLAPPPVGAGLYVPRTETVVVFAVASRPAPGEPDYRRPWGRAPPTA